MRQRLRHLPATVGATGGVTVLGVLVVALVAGGSAAAGFAAGGALVLASYLASSLAIAWADSVDPKLVFGVGIGAYVTKFSLFGLLLVWLLGTGWAGLPAMATGIVAAVVAWSAAQIWWVVRSRP